MKKSTYRIISIIFFLLGIFLQFMPILIDNTEKIAYCGTPIMCIGIVIFVYTFEYGSHHNKSYTLTTPQTKPNQTNEDQDFIDGYRWCDLQYFEKCVKLFYSQNGKKRLVFCKSNTFFTVRLQELEIYSTTVTNNPIYCASWKTISGKDSFFADLDIALKEYEMELSTGYVEENINEIYEIVWNRHPEYYSEIEWIKENNGGRKTIPYGNKYWPQIILGTSNKEYPEHSIVLINVEGLSKYTTLAIIRYAFEGAPNDLCEEMKITICEGKRKVATGIIKSKRENVDI